MAVAATGKGTHVNQPAAVGGGIDFFIVIEKGEEGVGGCRECFIKSKKNYSQCIEGDCENILHGYLYVFYLVFVILKGISILKFTKRFLEISSRDLTSFFLFCQS
jgi:hypothetical protein